MHVCKYSCVANSMLCRTQSFSFFLSAAAHKQLIVRRCTIRMPVITFCWHWLWVPWWLMTNPMQGSQTPEELMNGSDWRTRSNSRNSIQYTGRHSQLRRGCTRRGSEIGIWTIWTNKSSSTSLLWFLLILPLSKCKSFLSSGNYFGRSEVNGKITSRCPSHASQRVGH